MKSATVCHWLGIGVFALGMALGLMACARPYYAPPPLPPAPAPTPPPPQVVRPIYYIKATRLNLRACPGMDCPKISVLERGEEVEKIGASEDWFQVRVKRDGRLGWVDSRYLSATPVTPAPEAAPAPPPLPTAPPAVVTPPPEKPAVPAPPPKPPAVEKPPKAAKPTEEEAPPPKKKPEEAKPPKPAKPEEEAGPAAKPEKPAKPEEKPAPPTEPEGSKTIRIM